MEWLQVLSLFLANAALIFWFRSESRTDWRQMDNEMKQFREIWMNESRDFDARLQEYREKSDAEFKEFRERWMEESKDFHNRLCEIEAKRN